MTQLTLESAIHEQQPLLPRDRARLQNSASLQARAVVDVFMRWPYGYEFTPDEVWKLSGLNCPLTSIRRAITNLTTAGHLERTETMRPGVYGVANHCWRLKAR